MPTMRTIEQAIANIKKEDKDSCLTKHALRQLIINHQVPSVKVGCKYLVSLETLSSYLQGDLTPQASQEGIRRLKERI